MCLQPVRQTIIAITEIDRLTAEIDGRKVIERSHYDSLAAAAKMCVSESSSTSPRRATATPLGSWI